MKATRAAAAEERTLRLRREEGGWGVPEQVKVSEMTQPQQV